MRRLQALVIVLVLSFYATPSFAAAPRDRGGREKPRDPSPIVRIIKKIFFSIQSLEDPYMIPPRP
jgi:hypothetical protein